MAERDFEPGDVIVPKEHLRDWISWALQVHRMEAGTLYAFDLGGGLVYKFDPVKVEIYDFVKVPDNLLKNPNWRAADFYAEWFEKSYRGWTTGQLWNGSAMPYFEFDEAVRYAKDSEKLGADYNAVTRFDPARDAFITREGQEEEEVDEATVILVKGRGALKVYPIGTGSWTWAERDEG